MALADITFGTGGVGILLVILIVLGIIYLAKRV
jgi:hypothetical protein